MSEVFREWQAENPRGVVDDRARVVIGYSFPRRITMALRDAGLLAEESEKGDGDVAASEA